MVHVNPDTPGRAFALGQDRDRRIVAMKTLGLDHVEERLDGESDVADLIGQRLGRQIDTLAFEPRALAVQRDVLPELVEHTYSDEAGHLWTSPGIVVKVRFEFRFGSSLSRFRHGDGSLFSHALAGQLGAIGIVYKAIEDGVGDGWITKPHRVPPFSTGWCPI